MTSVFVDTSFYIAVSNPRDPAHARAEEWSRRHRSRMVTTEYVLMEFANSLSRVAMRTAAAHAISDIRHAPGDIVVASDTVLFQEALSLFADRPDKNWSLTDCASFIVMRRFGIEDALSTDEHFAQAGFRPLLVA